MLCTCQLEALLLKSSIYGFHYIMFKREASHERQKTANQTADINPNNIFS